MHATWGDERAVLDALARCFGPSRGAEVWSGDDAAVLRPTELALLVSTDLIVEGVHFRRSTSSLADIAWKSLAVNVSDIAAMGGTALSAVVALCGATGAELEEFVDALADASLALGCPIVGGDLSDGSTLVVTVTILGEPGVSGAVLRSGASAGEPIFVTAPLGRSAAGLRLLEEDPSARGPLVRAHRRPVPRPHEGRCAGGAGATAMIDVSDGLLLDLDRLARASHVGVALDTIPVASGATFEEACAGGEDYELLFTARDPDTVTAAFAEAELAVPILIGRTVEDAGLRTLAGEPFTPRGFLHRLG